MIQNTGKKIKNLANTIFVIELVLTFLGACGIANISKEFSIGLFLIVLLIGGILAFIMNLFLVAFGEMVENLQKTVELNEEMLRFVKECRRVDLQKISGMKSEENQSVIINDNFELNEELDLEHLLVNVLVNIKDFKTTYQVKKHVLQHIEKTGEKADGLLKALDKVIEDEKNNGPMLDLTSKYIQAYIQTFYKQ